MKNKLKALIFAYLDNQKWNNVNIRLPKTDVYFEEFLVYDTLNNTVHHDYWNSETQEWNHYGKHVTHWRKLPSFPKRMFFN